jgi:hypothetical protein
MTILDKLLKLAKTILRNIRLGLTPYKKVFLTIIVRNTFLWSALRKISFS